MRPVRSWALSTPVALTCRAVVSNPFRISGASFSLKVGEDILGDGENRVIIDGEDVGPSLEKNVLELDRIGVAQLQQG